MEGSEKGGSEDDGGIAAGKPWREAKGRNDGEDRGIVERMTKGGIAGGIPRQEVGGKHEEGKKASLEGSEKEGSQDDITFSLTSISPNGRKLFRE